MRTVTKLWMKITRYFSNMGLLRTLTLAYTVAILIPAIIIGVFTYKQSIGNVKREVALSTEQSLSQVREEIERKTMIVRGIGNNIAFNSKIQNLLYYGMNFTPDDLNYFIDSIAAPISYALNFSDANIYQIGVYFVNDRVPEYDHFYKEERIENLDWFKRFKESGQDEMWIYPAKSERFSSNGGVSDTRSVLKMVKKINSVDGKYLGVVTLDVAEEDMFSALNVKHKGYETFAVIGNKDIVYPKGYDTLEYEQTLNNIQGSDGYFFDKDELYTYNTITPLSIRLVSKTPIGTLARTAYLSSWYTILAVILGVAVLEIFTYFLLKLIFSRLNQIVGIMGIVAKGNFNIRIPVSRKDEVGQIAASFNVLIEKINDLINDVIKKERAQKDAQLIALQYQINPHFIYNTIDIFRMKLELEGNYELADSIAYFGKMLRYNINQTSQYATMEQEVDYIEKYIGLQKLRYKDKLKFEAHIPEELKNAKIIRFMLQPIVENAIKHGIKDINEDLLIMVKVKKEAERLEIQICDNGRGMSSEELGRLNHELRSSSAIDRKSFGDSNIGLANINKRIKLFYGEQYYIRMESLEERYTRVIINIPYVFD